VTAVHQIMVGAGPGDAITQMALDIQAELNRGRSTGDGSNTSSARRAGKIFAEYIGRGFTAGRQ
jgi:hypothetical protein